jgi:hypothetical protein
MRSIRILKVEYRILNNSSNVIKTCGLYVRKFVQKNRKTTQSYTHYTQPISRLLFIQNLYPFLYSQVTQGLHNIGMQTVSVNLGLYTLYTGPITTTTLNIYKKGM